MKLSSKEIENLKNGNPLQKAIYQFAQGELDDQGFTAFIYEMFGDTIGDGDAAARNAYIKETALLGKIEGPFNFWGMAKAAQNYWKYTELFGIDEDSDGADDYFPYLQAGSSSGGEYLYLSLDTGGIWCRHHDSVLELYGEDSFEIFEQTLYGRQVPAMHWLQFQQLCVDYGLGKVDPMDLEEHIETLGKISAIIFEEKWRLEYFFRQDCFICWEDQEGSIKKIAKLAAPAFKRKKLVSQLLKSRTQEKLENKLKAPRSAEIIKTMTNFYNLVKNSETGEQERQASIDQYIDLYEQYLKKPKAKK